MTGYRAARVLLLFAAAALAQEARPRAREIGLNCWTLPPGEFNAITDVKGVRVGHATLIRGENVRTGVTAILPHGGNLFQQKVRGAVFIGNAFGKLAGSTQVNELGEIETPVLLTNTLNVPRVADALIEYMLALSGNEAVRSINPLVGETNDGTLNDIRGRHAGRDEVFAAIGSAKSGKVDEGSVGAGTGTIAFGYKGGIGTASRRAAGFTVGVLVQSNFGGSLTMCGAPIGRRRATADGSIMMVVATDAPLDHRGLQRVAARTMMGLARTGSSGSHGSGDYAIAFTTSGEMRAMTAQEYSALFLGTIEAAEEAIYNSLLRATTVTGNGRTVEALPIDLVKAALSRR